MLVSIIIPVYKVEHYIGRCVESILNQSYQELEIILVDDCSPDSSMDIALKKIHDSEKSKDLTVKSLRHEKNRGLSAARNTGIDAATGDYIFFMDSDDEISPRCISTLISESDNGKIDVVCGGLSFCGDVELLGFDTHFVCYDALYQNSLDIVKAYAEGRIPISAWNKLLRRDVVLNERLYFKEGLLFEDNLWSFLMVHSVSSVKTLSAKTYNYWIRSGSIATSTDYTKRQSHMLVVIAERDKFVKSKGIRNKITRQYIVKDKALWLQTKICDGRFSFKEKYRFASSVLSLDNKCAVLGHFVFYYLRWVMHQIKCVLCH